jgi:hypothetical protein
MLLVANVALLAAAMFIGIVGDQVVKQDIPGWTDPYGNTCEMYSSQLWCCEESSPHCNAHYFNYSGQTHVQDDTDACQTSCAGMPYAPCVDDDAGFLSALGGGFNCKVVAEKKLCGALKRLGSEILHLCCHSCMKGRVQGTVKPKCPSGAVQLTAGATAASLDFRGGYRNNANCRWWITGCEVGQAVQLTITTFETEDSFDFVRLYDGEGNNTSIGDPLSGEVSMLHAPFGARSGSMLVAFQSDGSRTQAGFAAEFRCISAVVGCTDSTALNFDRTATVFGGCKYAWWRNQTAALRAAFIGHKKWAGVQGWQNASADPCGGGIPWTGVTCNFTAGINQHRVEQINLYPDAAQSWNFMLGSTIGELRSLTQLRLFGTAMSGTVPKGLGQLTRLTLLNLDGCTRVSGSLPETLGKLAKLERLWLDNTNVSGTLPEAIGQLTVLKRLYVFNTRVSGSLPKSLGEMKALEFMWLFSTSLSGTLPKSIAHLARLESLQLYSTSLSGTMSEKFGQLTALSSLLLQNLRLSGSLPSLVNCTNLTVLDVTNNSFTSLPAALPHRLDHLYLGANPLNTTLAGVTNLLQKLDAVHVLDFSFTSVGVALGQTRVQSPGHCRLGPGATPCTFTLWLYDNTGKDFGGGQPVRGTGGLLRGLMIGYGSARASMFDNHDGSFTATVNASWFAAGVRNNPYLFKFYDHHGDEFQPYQDVRGGHFYNKDELRKVTVLPRSCGSHMKADTDGTRCNCESNEFSEDALEPGASEVASCRRACAVAVVGTVTSRGGNGCECAHGTYNASAAGTLLCVGAGWSPVVEIQVEFKQQQLAVQDGRPCLPCPKECATCEAGAVTLIAGWRLNESTAELLEAQLASAAATRGHPPKTVFAFRCQPAVVKSGGCSALPLALGANASAKVGCKSPLRGALCGGCDEHYSKQEHGNTRCLLCGSTDTFKAAIGLSLPVFVAIAVTVALPVAAAVWQGRKHLKQLKKEVYTNGKILLGLAQVLTLLSDVLGLLFPQTPQRAMNGLSLLTLDVKQVFQLECHGVTWFHRWLTTTVLVPAVVAVLVAMRWLMHRIWRTDTEREDTDMETARQSAVGAGFFATMLLYPKVSASIFTLLRCRKLGSGEESWVLEADYDIQCSGTLYTYYKHIAMFLVVLVPVGVPAVLLSLLLLFGRRHRRNFAGTTDRETMRELLPGAEADTPADYAYSQLYASFSFCIDDFRPGCYWFEPVDLLRKLALTGLLQFVHRGTAAQVVCGCSVAVASLALQLILLPYRDPEANMLKALVDVQIFLTFLISFILRVFTADDDEFDLYEPYQATDYGYLLLGSMAAVAVTGLALTAYQARRRNQFRGRVKAAAREAFDGEVGTSGEGELSAEFGAVGVRLSTAAAALSGRDALGGLELAVMQPECEPTAGPGA